jgi:hypothetical protein
MNRFWHVRRTSIRACSTAKADEREREVISKWESEESCGALR